MALPSAVTLVECGPREGFQFLPDPFFLRPIPCMTCHGHILTVKAPGRMLAGGGAMRRQPRETANLRSSYRLSNTDSLYEPSPPTGTNHARFFPERRRGSPVVRTPYRRAQNLRMPEHLNANAACLLNQVVDTRFYVEYTARVEHSHPVILSLPPRPPGRGAFL